jgi:hypothetical protein
MNTYEKLYQAIKAHSDMDDDQIKEAGEHGADAGWPEFTYTQDAVRFYKKHEADIWELAREMAEDMDEPNVLAMVSKFNRADMCDDPDNFKTLMAWFALEEVGRWLENNPQESEEDPDEEDEEEVA